MTFSLQQILTDPKLQCPKGDVRVQLPEELTSTHAHVKQLLKLQQLLRNFQIKHTYHGKGLLTIHNK